jgi:hypothetical protein
MLEALLILSLESPSAALSEALHRPPSISFFYKEEACQKDCVAICYRDLCAFKEKAHWYSPEKGYHEE